MDEATRIAGHALRGEGAPFSEHGVRTGRVMSMAGEGHALCECGEMSEVLRSSPARRRWHRWHKADVRAAQNHEGGGQS